MPPRAGTRRTFASYLKHFAQSIDIVDHAVFDGVRELIYLYVRDELGAEYFELMREQDSGEGKKALRTFWSNGDRDHTLLVAAGPDGTYGSLVAAAFDLNKPVWIVHPDGAPLDQAGTYEDQWSGIQNLPPYQPRVSQPIRTAVVVPLRRSRVSGVYYLETSNYNGITDVAKTELQLLGDALAILFELWDVNKNQAANTRQAIFDLGDILRAATFPKLAKPSVFVAYSARAQRDVTNIIRQVLDKFSDRLDVTDWRYMTGAGNITVQTVKQITRARFGLCYLSEPADPDAGQGKYVDNANVLFEAGMLHALTAAEDEPAGWIPIREEESPQAPFDFAQERMVLVPRMQTGELNGEELRDRLEKSLGKLLTGPD